MGGMFSKAKKVKFPPVPPPGPVPVAPSVAEDEIRKSLRKRYGFEKTILTGALVPQTSKKTTLG